MSHGRQRSRIESVSATTQRMSARAVREVQRNSPFRQARTCYDHLAGVAGVHLLTEVIRRGWLVQRFDGARLGYQLTPEGTAALQALGVDLTDAWLAQRQFAYACLDWTERRPHVAGALGAVLLRALEAAGCIRREAGARTVQLSRALDQWLDASA